MTEISEIEKLLHEYPNVELDSELQDCVDKDDGPFWTLKHPLYYQVPYAPTLNGLINKGFASKKEMLKEKIEKKDLEGVIWLHERPYRLHALVTYWQECLGMPLLGIGALADWRISLAKAINQVWVDSENIWQNYVQWMDILEICEAPALQAVVDDDDKQTFADLPERLTVYRGGRIDWDDMMDSMPPFSWTLDKEKARWFAYRFEWKPDQHMITAEIDKDDVYFYTDERGEQEIVANPEGLEIKTIENMNLPEESPSLLEEL